MKKSAFFEKKFFFLDVLTYTILDDLTKKTHFSKKKFFLIFFHRITKYNYKITIKNILFFYENSTLSVFLIFCSKEYAVL